MGLNSQVTRQGAVKQGVDPERYLRGEEAIAGKDAHEQTDPRKTRAWKKEKKKIQTRDCQQKRGEIGVPLTRTKGQT